MKAMKKIFAVILVLSLVFTFSACGKKGDDTTTESSSPETTLAPTEYHSEWVTDAAVVTPPTTEPQTQATTQAPTESQTQATTQAPTEAPKPTTGVSNYKATYKGVEQSVYYPNSINASSTPLPVISWANGTGFSYTIYESLLKEMISMDFSRRGYYDPGTRGLRYHSGGSGGILTGRSMPDLHGCGRHL